MRFCYADPPYPGMAHLYKDHPDYAGEVDHKQLIERLVAEFPDGWALSTDAAAVRRLWLMMPEGTRQLVWIRPDAEPSGNRKIISWGWEAVFLRTGQYPVGQVKDFLVCPKAGLKLIGAKPELFCFWLFRCLGALPGDELVELFPGSGAVGRAWDKYQRQMTLPMERPKERQMSNFDLWKEANGW